MVQESSDQPSVADLLRERLANAGPKRDPLGAAPVPGAPLPPVAAPHAPVHVPEPVPESEAEVTGELGDFGELEDELEDEVDEGHEEYEEYEPEPVEPSPRGRRAPTLPEVAELPQPSPTALQRPMPARPAPAVPRSGTRGPQRPTTPPRQAPRPPTPPPSKQPKLKQPAPRDVRRLEAADQRDQPILDAAAHGLREPAPVKRTNKLVVVAAVLVIIAAVLLGAAILKHKDTTTATSKQIQANNRTAVEIVDGQVQVSATFVNTDTQGMRIDEIDVLGGTVQQLALTFGNGDREALGASLVPDTPVIIDANSSFTIIAAMRIDRSTCAQNSSIALRIRFTNAAGQDRVGNVSLPSPTRTIAANPSARKLCARSAA